MMLGQIEQEIEEIRTAIADMEGKIESVSLAYADAVAQAVRQQLMTATYQLCTHSYPEAFLALTVSERQKLQHGMQAFANRAAQTVSDQLKLNKLKQRDRPSDPKPESPQSLDQESAESPAQEAPEFKEPESIEKLLSKILEDVSRSANQLLAAAELLEISDRQDEQGKSEDKSINANASNAAKIELRLSDVEFNNREVMSHHSELRVLTSKLQQLERELDKKQKAKMVVEAERAWRASWSEIS